MLLPLSAMASQLRLTGIVFDCGFKIVRPQASGSSILMLNASIQGNHVRRSTGFVESTVLIRLDFRHLHGTLRNTFLDALLQVPRQTSLPRINISLHATSSTHHSFIFASVRAA